MTDDRLELSRRKILAGIGAVGVAGAGAGMGTSAYFSDQETFTNNSLTAGELDMKIAATEYYSDWSSDEAALAGMADGPDSTDIRLPAPDDNPDARDIALDLNDVEQDPDIFEQFVEAIASNEGGDSYSTVNGGISAATDDGLCGDTPAADADGPVIIDISDVKPGDFGGAQFAFELCDNPGYLWLQGALRDASENGLSEPEAEDPQEEEGVVELLDEIQVAYGVGGIQDSTAFEDTDAGFQPTNQMSLREFLKMADNFEGIPLAGDTDAEDGGGAGRDCFAGSPDEGSAVHQVSVIWWLPIDHGNQVQTDSVTFDLGFYTEQCRHNEGVGLSTDLVGYYPLDTVEDGTAEDLSGNGNDGTVQNGVSDVTGQVADAAQFDGDDDYVDLGAQLTQSFSSMTVAAWIKNGSSGGYQAIVERNYWNADDGFGLFVNDQKASWGHYSGGPTVTSTATVRDGNWHHVAGTLEPDGNNYTYTIYVDGQPDGSATIGRAVTSSSEETGIGRRIANFAGDYYFQGAIDDVRIYDRALSDQEIQSLANQ